MNLASAALLPMLLMIGAPDDSGIRTTIAPRPGPLLIGLGVEFTNHSDTPAKVSMKHSRGDEPRNEVRGDVDVDLLVAAYRAACRVAPLDKQHPDRWPVPLDLDREYPGGGEGGVTRSVELDPGLTFGFRTLLVREPLTVTAADGAGRSCSFTAYDTMVSSNTSGDPRQKVPTAALEQLTIVDAVSYTVADGWLERRQPRPLAKHSYGEEFGDDPASRTISMSVEYEYTGGVVRPRVLSVERSSEFYRELGSLESIRAGSVSKEPPADATPEALREWAMALAAERRYDEAVAAYDLLFERFPEFGFDDGSIVYYRREQAAAHDDGPMLRAYAERLEPIFNDPRFADFVEQRIVIGNQVAMGWWSSGYDDRAVPVLEKVRRLCEAEAGGLDWGEDSWIPKIYSNTLGILAERYEAAGSAKQAAGVRAALDRFLGGAPGTAPSAR